MVQEAHPNNMVNFVIVWIGQLVSMIGTSMSSFALSIWAWESTGQATALTLVVFFALLPSIIIAPISGVIVDRFDRKLLMVLGDTVSVILTMVILWLYLTNHLQIWHLYVINLVRGGFDQIQSLAYSVTVSLMVPKKHYARANSMEFMSSYGADILSPALAAYFYHVIGLVGIALIDIFTFVVAISSILLIHIPQPPQTEPQDKSFAGIWQDLGFGWRYIQARQNLRALLIAVALFEFAHDISNAIYSPLILARSGNNTTVLGSVVSAAGFGGVIGAIIFSAWGGFRRRIKGFLLGIAGAGISKVFFGLGQTPLVWIPAQFCSSLNFPLKGSSETAIWLTKVAPQVQGRVFAMRSLLLQLVSAVAYLIAGPLADQVFEPAMMPQGSLTPIFGRIFGTGTGAGLALIYVCCAFWMFLVGLFGYRFHSLRDVEIILPDHDADCS